VCKGGGSGLCMHTIGLCVMLGRLTRSYSLGSAEVCVIVQEELYHPLRGEVKYVPMSQVLEILPKMGDVLALHPGKAPKWSDTCSKLQAIREHHRKEKATASPQFRKSLMAMSKPQLKARVGSVGFSDAGVKWKLAERYIFWASENGSDELKKKALEAISYWNCSVCNGSYKDEVADNDLRQYIGCDGCFRWYHAGCLDVQPDDVNDKKWYCKDKCKPQPATRASPSSIQNDFGFFADDFRAVTPVRIQRGHHVNDAVRCGRLVLKDPAPHRFDNM